MRRKTGWKWFVAVLPPIKTFFGESASSTSFIGLGILLQQLEFHTSLVRYQKVDMCTASSHQVQGVNKTYETSSRRMQNKSNGFQAFFVPQNTVVPAWFFLFADFFESCSFSLCKTHFGDEEMLLKVCFELGGFFLNYPSRISRVYHCPDWF